jgi:hypothetical protein
VRKAKSKTRNGSTISRNSSANEWSSSGSQRAVRVKSIITSEICRSLLFFFCSNIIVPIAFFLLCIRLHSPLRLAYRVLRMRMTRERSACELLLPSPPFLKEYMKYFLMFLGAARGASIRRHQKCLDRRLPSLSFSPLLLGPATAADSCHINFDDGISAAVK